jgi:hypothetical protein
VPTAASDNYDDSDNEEDFIFNESTFDATTRVRKLQKAVKSTSAKNSILSARAPEKSTHSKKRRTGSIARTSNRGYMKKAVDEFEKFVSDEEDEEDFNSSLKANNFKFYYGEHLNKCKCLECGESDLVNHYK